MGLLQCFLILVLMTFARSQLIYVNSAVYKFVIGVSVPIALDSPGHGLGWSVNLQGLYRTPDNVSYFEPYKVIQKRSIRHQLHRSMIYELIDKQIERVGLRDEQCVERLICEVARLSEPVTDRQRERSRGGILHLLTILFTPRLEDLQSRYEQAQFLGLQNTTKCVDLYKCCALSYV